MRVGVMRLPSKGQLVIPAELRAGQTETRAFSWGVGTGTFLMNQERPVCGDCMIFLREGRFLGVRSD